VGCSVDIVALTKTFDDTLILDDINLSVMNGEAFVILGTSGSGKSILMSIISSLVDFDCGSITIDHISLSHITKKNQKLLMRKINYLFQNNGLFDFMTLWENVSFYNLHGLHMNTKQAKKIALEKLEYVGINESCADLYPSQISGGMQKRVGIARAIANEVEMILFDEPTSGLDPIASTVISKLIARCSRELGITTITITHDINTTKIFADRIGLLHHGKLLWTGTMTEFFETNSPIIAQFTTGSTTGPLAFS